MPNDLTLARQFSLESQRHLDEALRKIEHCVRQLTDDDVWWRPSEEMNSIGNVMLHLSGNVRQWIVSGVGGAPDVRDRPAEFAERQPIARTELMAKLRATVDEAKAALERCDGRTCCGLATCSTAQSPACTRRITPSATSSATRRRSRTSRGCAWARSTSSWGSRRSHTKSR